MTEACDISQYLIGGLGPDKGLGILVGGLHVPVDGSFQVAAALMHTPAQLLLGSFDPTVFTKNRRRLLEHRIGQTLFDEVAVEADRQGLLSAEHFSVDGTLIEAAASIKSFRRRDEERQPPDDDPGNPSVDFRGERRSNETHQSRTDPEAQLMRKGKGKEARLVFMGHALMENRNGLLMDFVVSGATGTSERDAVPVMLDDARERGFRPKTLGGDRGYDTRQCVKDMRDRGVTPHVAQRVHSAIDGRTTRHPGYGVSQKIRKHIRVDEDGGRLPPDSVSGS